MKKFSIFAICALLLVAFSVPAMAKVNLSGAMWATFWAQQEATVAVEYVNAGVWQSAVGGPSTLGYDGATSGSPLTFGNYPVSSKKTFIVGQGMSGNGNIAHTVQRAQDGFVLVADCPVNDWIKGYAEVTAGSAGLGLTLREGYANLAFMKELNLAAGLMEVPFGHEHAVRPDAGIEEVFISEYSQDARATLQTQSDIGVKVFGTVGSGLIGGGVGMIDYQVFVGNGGATTVADTGIANPEAGQVIDRNDAKQVVLDITIKPIQGLYVGGGYSGGDYTNANPGIQNARARFSAYDFNAGYDIANVLLISGEYATVRHDKMREDFQFGMTAQANTLQQVRVNEYVIKAIYDGIQDFELGVRYGVVDPKQMEAEVLAGYSMERKLSFGGEYKIARGAVLKAEYSMVMTDLNYLDAYSLANALVNVNQNSRISPSEEMDDDIFALQLGLQF